MSERTDTDETRLIAVLGEAITMQHESYEECTCEDLDDTCWYRLTDEEKRHSRLRTVARAVLDAGFVYEGDT